MFGTGVSVEHQRTSDTFDQPKTAAFTPDWARRNRRQWLERVVSEHEGEVVWLKVLPDYDSLRSEARFTKLLERINLT